MSSYDLVLAESAKWLGQAAELVKPGGTILLVMDKPTSDIEEWRRVLQGTDDALDEQAAFRESHGRFVVVAKTRSSDSHLSRKFHLLEASPNSHVQVSFRFANKLKAKQWSDENATYVVAGGLGDIGQRLLCLMAERGAKHVATISRRVLDPEVSYNLQKRLEAVRPEFRLYTLQGDITSEPSIQKAAAELVSDGAPPVRGIIQAAIVLIVSLNLT